MRYYLDAGSHARIHCPVRLPSAEMISYLTDDVGRTIPVQRDGDSLVFLSPDLSPGQRIVLQADTARRETDAQRVTIEANGQNLRILLDGELFTHYFYQDLPSRPYFFPVLAPGSIPVTRAYPMQSDVPGETTDHPHHRSLYTAFGEVNGVDNWTEQSGHGLTRHQAFTEIVSGAVFGRFTAQNLWTEAAGKPLLSQTTCVTVWSGSPTLRLMDFLVTFTATEGDVLFGDTKEGGILTVRVATEMDVTQADGSTGGRIENAYGGVGEAETWGKSAHWCDYSGVVGGQAVGVAILDHPESFRYPTYWHVRNYGLMAANPFALGEYTHGAKRGDHLLKAGETMRFSYRLVVHRGDTAAADIRGQYLNFVSPPTIQEA